MTVINLQDAFSHLDDELIDNYLTCKRQNRARLARRQVMRKRMLTCAACFMLVAAVTLSVAYHIRYPTIPLENAVGDVSARYVPEWMVEGNPYLRFPDCTEESLFEYSDYIFSGTVNDISFVRIMFDGQIIYRSLITIAVENMYKGEKASTIVINSPPFVKKDNANDLLHTIKKGSYGIFIVEKNKQEDTLIHNKCALPLSDLSDAVIRDNFSFAFINNGSDNVICYDTIHEHPEKFFASLDVYDWDSVLTYVNKMLKGDFT